MSDPHLVLCGGLRPADAPRGWRRADRTVLQVGQGENVHLRVEHLARTMTVSVPDLAMDLLEVAAYVFAADQSLGRGGTSGVDYGAAWHRRLRFIVPVRRPDRWQQPAVMAALTSALNFLTDDEYEFAFVPATNPAVPASCLFDGIVPDGTEFRDVVLFSGGLNSLCGAVEEVLRHKHRVVLVSHRSATRLWPRQQELFEALVRRVAKSRPKPLHVGVTVNKGEQLNREFTQRSRSFVFASVAAVVARQVGLDRIRFYENGATSLNLPVSPELVGARASRTTHPQSLRRFGELFSLLFDRTFEVQNPYQRSTKAEMLARLKAWGHSDLCKLTCSCGHIWAQPEGQPHCGRCSQCIERRVSVLAAGLTDDEDPPDRYESDPITGERAGPDLTFAERYVGAAREVEKLLTPRALAARYPEVYEAIPYLGDHADGAAGLIHDLCRRNADGVLRAVWTAATAHANALIRQEIPARSLLGAALGRTVAPRAPAPPPAPADRGFSIVREEFAVRYNGHSCDLGNTLEFLFVERLQRSRGTYLPIGVIGKDVWDDETVSKNAVQAVASNLRRKLRPLGLPEDFIDGSRKGHYGLKPPPA
ncbi:hypothetical protein [Gemmata sp.]|uniref:hypothetical protein n=1 Tax=Gemmata sp. TaxID=1914242 RepID=UPI003F717935